MANVKLARLDDLDKPIYRVFPLWFFEESLRLKSLTLVPPSAWEDPIEDMLLFSAVTLKKNFKQHMIGELLPAAQAQCWSYECHSDTLLRAYSRVARDPTTGRNTDPRNEGVRVKTTPRLLVGAMKRWSSTWPGAHFYLGRVIYEPQDAIGTKIANMVQACGPAGLSDPNRRADSLFFKRDYFRQEDEVRLLCIWADPKAPKDHMKLTIEPNELFLEVEFDPRLLLFENRERQERARSVGYSGKFVESPIYTRIFFDIVIEAETTPWSDYQRG